MIANLDMLTLLIKVWVTRNLFSQCMGTRVKVKTQLFWSKDTNPEDFA